MKSFKGLLLAAALLALPLAACGAMDRTGRDEADGGTNQTVETPPLPETQSYISVRVDGLNVRTGAGTDSVSVGQAEKGTLLPFEGSEGGWLRTLYRGKTAYVSADPAYTELVLLEKGDEKTERVIAEGCRLLGVPYVYGATRYHDGKGHLLKGFSEEKFDCSSLMQYIFARGAGVLLDVTTRTQVLQGEHVGTADIARGDLLFFTNASRCSETGTERVGHVALYLGGGYILHTASDFSKIETISDVRQSYFLEARRVL